MEKYPDDLDTHPKSFQPWILDSGGFTEITRYGEWHAQRWHAATSERAA